MNKTIFIVWFLAFALLIHASFAQDLIITGVGGNTTCAQYEALPVTVTIKNQGIVDISNKTIQTRAYLSTDDILDAQDTQIGFKTRTSLAANTSVTESLFAASEFFLTPGTYRLIVKTDHTNGVVETDETNNLLVVPGYTITPAQIDFSIASLNYTSSTVAPYDYMFPTYTIQNTGTTQISSVYTTFYLSVDNTLDAGDIQLGHSYSNVGTAVSDYVPFPPAANGNYFIIANTDDLNRSTTPGYSRIETNELNNTNVKAITIKSSDIDLDLVTPTKPTATFDAERSIVGLDFNLKNNGTTGAVNYKANLYLSTDQTLDEGSDIHLGGEFVMRHSSYYAGPGKTINNDITVDVFPSSVPPNIPYYVIVKFNGDKSMPESNYTNNTAVSSGTIVITSSGTVNIGAASVSSTYNDKDKVIDIMTTYSNSSGTTFSDMVSYGVKIINSSGTTVHNDYMSEYLFLSPYQNDTKPVSFSLSKALPHGNYRIQFSCGSPSCGNDFYELPLSIEQTTFAFSGTIQTEDETPLTSGKLFLYQKDPSGNVKFTQQIDPVTASNFNFQVDGQPYTLYFIPDPVAYPNAIPTILGKTILLNENSFVKLTADYATPLTVLEIEPLLVAGNKIISGNVKTGDPNGRIAMGEKLQLDEELLPVILLSDAGVPVAITYTNASGDYEFNNLPEGNYSLIVSLPLEELQFGAPVAVDVSSHNARVDFDISGGTIAVDSEILQLAQIITFGELPTKTFGSVNFSIEANANSGLETTYTSSDPTVATVNNNEISIVGAGSTIITAYQDGNVDFLSAEPVERILVIEKADQDITFESLPSKQSDDGSFTLTALASSSLPVVFTSDDESIASVTGSLVTIHGAGTVNISAVQEGNTNYNPAVPVARTLVINLVTGLESPTAILQAYPNPTKGKMRLPYPGIHQVVLADVLGRTETVAVNDQVLDLTNHESGVYLIKFSIMQKPYILKVVRE